MQILYPPRPKNKILPSRLGAYETSGKWVVQRKFNGTRIVLHVAGKDCYLLNRHGESPKQFQLTNALKSEILSLKLDPNLQYWFDGELLDAKTKTAVYKNKIVLFDVLQAGRYFFGSPDLTARLSILKDICRCPQEKEPNLGIALRITDNIWMAETFTKNFVDRFQDFLVHDEIEGVMLKKKDSVIKDFGKKEYDVAWQIRCRKPHKNYSF